MPLILALMQVNYNGASLLQEGWTYGPEGWMPPPGHDGSVPESWSFKKP